jgi:putative flippase GtrA
MRARPTELVRYAIVGVLNSAIGIGSILALSALGVPDVTANAVGFCVGFACSYALNGLWTFRSRRLDRSAFAGYAIVVAICYGANLLALVSLRHAGLDPRAAQVCGVAVYSVLAYLGMKHFAFRRRSAVGTPR